MIQGSDEWHLARLGQVTASRVKDVIAKGRGGAPSASRKNYLAQLVTERLTGQPTESFSSPAMEYGTQMEAAAAKSYAFMQGVSIKECGYFEHPTIPMAGASPDRVVGDEGLAEFKCPNSSTHIDTLMSGKIAGQYITQMDWQLACTGRQWCDFVSYDARLPVDMQLWVHRHHRDEARIAQLEMAVSAFLREVDETVGALMAQYRGEEAA